MSIEPFVPNLDIEIENPNAGPKRYECYFQLEPGYYPDDESSHERTMHLEFVPVVGDVICNDLFGSGDAQFDVLHRVVVYNEDGPVKSFAFLVGEKDKFVLGEDETE